MEYLKRCGRQEIAGLLQSSALVPSYVALMQHLPNLKSNYQAIRLDYRPR